MDSNHRSHRRQIYSLFHLTALEPLREDVAHDIRKNAKIKTFCKFCRTLVKNGHFLTVF